MGGNLVSCCPLLATRGIHTLWKGLKGGAVQEPWELLATNLSVPLKREVGRETSLWRRCTSPYVMAVWNLLSQGQSTPVYQLQMSTGWKGEACMPGVWASKRQLVWGTVGKGVAVPSSS